jgi:ABC-type Fe3+ transport system permease subunit
MLSALYTLSDFGAVSILSFDTFTRAIYSAFRSSFDRSGAASLAAILVLITVVLIHDIFLYLYTKALVLSYSANAAIREAPALSSSFIFIKGHFRAGSAV